MSQEHKILVDNVSKAIATQIAVLHELAEDLAELGFDEEAHRIDKTAIDLDREEHPVTLVREAVPLLRAVAARLQETTSHQMDQVAQRILQSARALAGRADRVLSETQPIDDEDKPRRD